MVSFLASVIKYKELDRYVSGGYLQTRTMTRGLPQGSVFSPLLFNIYISQIESCLPLSISALLYADDIMIYCSHQFINYVADQLNVARENVNQHFQSLGLRLSPIRLSLRQLFISSTRYVTLNGSLKNIIYRLNWLTLSFRWSSPLSS